MKATYLDLYKKRSATGELMTVFTYGLSGSEAELQKYKAIQEDAGYPAHTHEESGKLIYFDTVYHGPTCEVRITPNNKVIVPNAELDFLQSQLRLASDPTVKAALATAIAGHMVNKITSGAFNPTPTAIPTFVAPTAPDDSNAMVIDDEPVAETADLDKP